MKVMIISQPKAGTYLCNNLMEEFGFESSYKHLNKTNYQAYDKNNLENCKSNPRQYDVNVDISQSVQTIKDNQVAMTHLSYSKDLQNIFKDFKKILLTRDKQNRDKSWERFKKIRPWNSIPTEGHYDNIKAWNKCEDVFELQFDDMINKNTTQLDKLQLFLVDEIKYNSEQAMCSATQKPSITKSNIR